MSNKPSSNPHQSYMLRLWQVEDQGKIIWRSSLQEVATSKQKGFENLENLFQHLREKTAQPSKAIHLEIDEKFLEEENLHIKISFYRKE